MSVQLWNFMRWWVLMSKIFGQKSIYVLNGNHCILKIRGAPVCKKFGMILENKVVKNLKLEKKGFFLQKMVS